MLFFSPRKLHHSNRQPKLHHHTNSSIFQIENLENRIVPSGNHQILTVGAGYQYPTITAALAAANSNASINIYPGTYTEAVTVTKNGIQLNAEGAPGSVIVQPTTVTPVTLSGVIVGGAAIDIYANNVVVNGLTVDGSLDSDINLWAGIRVIEGGSATIKNNTVEGMLYGSPNTDVGIQVGTSLVSGSLGSGTAKVTNNTVFDYAGAGVLVDGSGAVATIASNIITGRGTANLGINEYGVQVSNLASALVEFNTICGNTIDGSVSVGYNPSPTSAGIFFYNDGNTNSVASSNTIIGNDDGILVQQSNGTDCQTIQLANNNVQQNYGYAGIFVLSSNNVVVLGNTVSNNTTLNGIALNLSSNVQVDGNSTNNNVNADGIYDFEGTNNQIAWNYSFSNGNNGINIDTTTSDLLIYNATWKNAYNGIQITGGSNNSIWLGASYTNDQDGILLINTTGNALVGNVLSNNGGSGLHLVNAQNTKIAFNSIHGNAAGSITIDSQSTGTLELQSRRDVPPLEFGSSEANGGRDSHRLVYFDGDHRMK